MSTLFCIKKCFLPLLLAVLTPISVFAIQSGGGYTVYDRVEVVSGAVSGGGYSSYGGVYKTEFVVPTATPTPTPTPSTSSSGRGGSSTSGSTGESPSPSQISSLADTFLDILKKTLPTEAPYRIDAFADNRIDALDFNVLLVNWGVESGDRENASCTDKISADINCDSVVDVLDFNLLMVNWDKPVAKK